MTEIGPAPQTLTITGNPNDNLEVESQVPSGFTLTYNGTTATYSTSLVNKIIYNGPIGAASNVIFEAENSPEVVGVTQTLLATSVNATGFQFDANNVQTLYVYSSEDLSNNDDVSLAGGSGDSYYVYSATGNYSYLADPAEHIYSELSGFSGQSVEGGGGSTYGYIYSNTTGDFVGDARDSSFENFPEFPSLFSNFANFPQLYFVGSSGGGATLNTDGGSFVGTPDYSYVSGTLNGASFLIGALYTSGVTAQATNPTDSAFLYSGAGDVFNGNPIGVAGDPNDLPTSLTGSAAAFASFPTFGIETLGFQNVTVEESGTGTDVANLSSSGGGVFISSPTVSTLAVNGVTAITVITASLSNGSFQPRLAR